MKLHKSVCVCPHKFLLDDSVMMMVVVSDRDQSPRGTGPWLQGYKPHESGTART